MRRWVMVVSLTALFLGVLPVAAQAGRVSVDRVEHFQTVVAVAPIDGPPVGALMRADCAFALLAQRPDGSAIELIKCRLSDDPVDVPEFQGTPPETVFIDAGGPCIWQSDYWAVKDGSTVFAERFEVVVTPSGGVSGRAEYPPVPLDCGE